MSHYNYDYTTNAYLHGAGALENAENNSPVQYLREEKRKPIFLQILKWAILAITSLFGIVTVSIGVSEDATLSYTLAGSAFILPMVWFAMHERRDRKNPATTMNRHWAVILLICIAMFFTGIFLIPTP